MKQRIPSRARFRWVLETYSRILCGFVLLLLPGSALLFAQPSIDAIPNLTVPAGKSVVIPVFGNSTNNWKLNYTARSSQPGAISAQVHSDNPWLKMAVQDFGEMTFMIFRDRTPKTAKFIRDLADTAFYDGLTFHRIIPGFVIQTGDPVGDGSGGPDFSYEDEFDPTLMFTGNGQLALANSGKDSNGSQLFVTMGQQRALDFNHTIFGQLVRGFDVLQKIAAAGTTNGIPSRPVVITRAGTVTNYADTVVTLTAHSPVGATSTVTLTATDSHGGEVSRSFDVRVVADTVDDPVILTAVTNQIAMVGKPLTFHLGAIDLENNPIEFVAQLIGDSTNFATLSINSNLVSVLPQPGFAGPIYCLVGARQKGAIRRGSTQNPFDIQLVTIGVGAEPLIAYTTNILSIPNFALVNRTVAFFKTPSNSRDATNFSASIIWGDFRQTQGDVARLPDGTFVAYGSHRYLVPGEYRITVTLYSDLGSVLEVESRALVLPSLSIEETGNETVVSWPFVSADFSLQRASKLGTTSIWEPLPISISPGQFTIEARMSDATNAFFRLRRP